jgi:hypothetical protein
MGLVHLVQVEPAGPEPVGAGHGALFHYRGDRHDREDLPPLHGTVLLQALRAAAGDLEHPHPEEDGSLLASREQKCLV